MLGASAFDGHNPCLILALSGCISQRLSVLSLARLKYDASRISHQVPLKALRNHGHIKEFAMLLVTLRLLLVFTAVLEALFVLGTTYLSGTVTCVDKRVLMYASSCSQKTKDEGEGERRKEKCPSEDMNVIQ